MTLHGLMNELKRRHVTRVVLMYGAGAFALLQAADLVFPMLGLPSWTVRLVLALVLLGFPVALLLAWLFEVTPEGVRRHASLDAEGALTRERRAAPVVVAVVVLLVAGSYALFARGSGESNTTASAVRDRSIAVLPFDNLSASEENEYFSDGITEDIITQLAQVADLLVTSRVSVMAYKDSTLDARTIAAELGVRHILEGSVRREGDQIRVVAQLIDAETDRHLWAETYDRALSDVFEIQSEVARQIASALQARLSASETARMAEGLTKDPEAYDLYLRARAMWGSSYDSNLASFALLRDAVALDPTFASAFAALSYGYTQLVEDFGAPRALVDTAVVLAREAIRISPEYFEGHNALGYALFHQGQLTDSYASVRRATELNPGSSDAMSMMALLERELGDPAASIDWALRGYRTDPLAAWHPNHLLVGYTMVGEYAEAERWLRKGMEVAPAYTWIEINGWWLDALTGRTAEAWSRARSRADAEPGNPLLQIFALEAAVNAREWRAARAYGERLLALNPSQAYGDYRLSLAGVYSKLGEPERSRALTAAVIEETRAEMQRSDRPQLAVELGFAHALEGDADAAFAAWDKAFATLYVSPEELLQWSLPDEIRQDPRFTRLVEEQRGQRDVFRRRLGLSALGA